MFSMLRRFERYAALYTFYMSSITEAQKEKSLFWKALDTIVNSRRQKKPPPGGFLFDLIFLTFARLAAPSRLTDLDAANGIRSQILHSLSYKNL